VDCAIVGGGFTGLAAAAWLRHLNPQKTVALFEAKSIGSGSSGRTGGMVLAESAAGDLPGLGDVLAGASKILQTLEISCDFDLPGGWELERNENLADTPISWNDSGPLRVARNVPGGTLDPGKLLTGLAHTAQHAGATIFENARVENILFGDTTELTVSASNLPPKKVLAHDLLLATNAESLELSELSSLAQPKFTLALATAPLTSAQLTATGLSAGKPFYTIDFPYLWGRLLPPNQAIFGSGLVHLTDWRELSNINVNHGQPAELLASLESRVRALHPALHDVKFTHRWGGPILIADRWQPVFERHPQSSRAIVLGAYSGHGVALSLYLGSWAAEAMLDRKELPDWKATSA
jgi:gamma-glutamylputrescine oxidase